MPPNNASGLSTIECHLLLAIVGGPMHGYAIRDAVEAESSGTLKPRAGTLYRVIARMIARGYIAEAVTPNEELRHPGRERRYYQLTREGRTVLSEEASRLTGVAALAHDRLGAG